MLHTELQKTAQQASRSRASDYFAKQVKDDEKSESPRKSIPQNIFARPPLSEIAREAEIFVKEWANWKSYHGLLTYNIDKSGVLQLFKHQLDSDPYRIISMCDLMSVKIHGDFSSSEASYKQYEWVLKERNGGEIHMAACSSQDRVSWMTAMGLFVRIDGIMDPRLGRKDKNQVEVSLNAKFKKEPSQDVLEKIEEFQTLILGEIRTLRDTSSFPQFSQNSNLKVHDDRSTHAILASMNNKLVRLLAGLDYTLERLATGLHRDQDIIQNQTRLENSLETQGSQWRDFQRLVLRKQEILESKLDRILGFLAPPSPKSLQRSPDSSETLITHRYP